MFRPSCVIVVLMFLPLMGFKSITDGYSVKLAYIEKFTRFIQWSDKNAIDSNGDFKIGIITPNPFKKYTESFERLNKIKSKSIKCVEVSNLSVLPAVNVLFIPDGHDFSLESILSKFKAQQPVIISERKGYAKKGTHINFYNENNRVRFEINYDLVEKDGYSMSPQLLKIAKLVK